MNPTNRCTKADVVQWLTPTLEKLKLTDYTITISGSSLKGDGYLGDITFVEVREKSSEKLFSFVVKTGKKSPELRRMMPVRCAFENEIYFYEKILPVFDDFQREKKVEQPFRHAPKCYDTLVVEDMEVLILENVKQRGFSLHDRRRPMDEEHLRKTMEVYGKLHAISFALRDQKPEVFEELSGRLYDILKLMKKMPKNIPDNYNVFESVIKAAKEENEDEVVEKANLLNEFVVDGEDITDPTDPYAVILHGDCWNNNFMFKYDDSNLSEVCFLDFQISRLASPVYDLSYHLFTCLSESDVPKFDEFINVYYDSLCRNLREMGSDPDKMFPFEELQKQWKKFAIFGLSLIPSIVKICLSDEDEVPDLVEAAETGTSFATMFGKAVRSEVEYRNRTVPIMKLAIAKGFI